MKYEAGRELDRIIAEKVMGWKRGGAGDHTKPGHVRETRHRPGRPVEVVDILDWDMKGPHDYLVSPTGDKVMFCGCDTRPHVTIPAYSTDIAHAWEVVERLQSMGWGFGLTGYPTAPGAEPGEPFKAIFFAEHLTGLDGSGDAPLAICRAALKAVA